MAVGFTDPNIILASHLIKYLTIMCGKDQRRLMTVNGFILIEADHVFDQSFMEMILYLVDQQVEAFFQGSNDHCIE